MKKLKARRNVYLEEFDIEVKPYLNMDEINTIVEAVKDMTDYVERMALINMFVVKNATNMSDDDFAKLDVNLVVTSGFLYKVLGVVENLDMVYDCIAMYDGADYKIGVFLDKMLEEIQNMEKNAPKEGQLSELLNFIKEYK